MLFTGCPSKPGYLQAASLFVALHRSLRTMGILRLAVPKGLFFRHAKGLGQKAPPVEFSPEEPSPSTHL